eukprot:2358246-Pyramimonas_sp.AAC.1
MWEGSCSAGKQVCWSSSSEMIALAPIAFGRPVSQNVFGSLLKSPQTTHAHCSVLMNAAKAVSLRLLMPSTSDLLQS